MTYLRRRLRQENGIALIMAVGVLFVLTIVGASLIFYSNSNARSAKYSGRSAAAYDLAEAGVNRALAVLYNPSNNALNRYLLGLQLDGVTVVPTTEDIDEGSVSWSGVLTEDILNPYWTITATGSRANPSGGADVTRTITAKVPITAQLTASPTNESWNFVYSAADDGDPTTCDTTIDNNPNFASPLYVEGDLCITNTGQVDAGPLVVQGRVTITHKNGQIGTSAAPVDTVEIGDGCVYWNKTNHVPGPCKNGNPPNSGNGDNIWVQGLAQDADIPTPSSSQTKPIGDFDSWYNTANPGPKYPCVATNGSAPNGSASWSTAFDIPTGAGAAVRDNNNPLFYLTPATSYTCQSPGGELSWDATSSVLTVRGTIFIDGSAILETPTPDVPVRYEGIAAIYVSGSLYLHQTNLCAILSGSDCDWSDGAWDPDTNILVFAADGSGDTSPVPSGTSILARQMQFQGALYGTNKVELDTNTETQGPMVASEIKLDNTIFPHTFPLAIQVPFGIPGNAIVTATVGAPQLYPD